MTTLIIARHGNTFEPGEPPRRVGAKTDLPLVETGRKQAQNIGFWLKDHKLIPEIVYSSSLRRTIETAEIAIAQTEFPQPVFPLDIFNEIDYGPDENKPEEEVIARLGEQALKDWDEQAKVPDGWSVDPNQIIENWKNFAVHAVQEDQECVLVVTSNGIVRFAPHITGDFEGFRQNHSIKISTGALCVLAFENNSWTIQEWNLKP